MASGMHCFPNASLPCLADLDAAHIANPQQETDPESEAHLPLPQTLVRIPMQHVDQSETAQSENGDDSTVK
jgi:DASH complex subunit DAD2